MTDTKKTSTGSDDMIVPNKAKGATHENQKECIVLVGRQAVGKSSLSQAIIAAYKKRGGQVLVLAPHPEQFGKDGILCNVSNADILIRGIMDEGFQGLVVLDDVDSWMNARSNAVVTELCSTFRHYGIDILVSTRAIQQINMQLRRCFTRVCVFKMHEPRAVKAVKDLLGEFPKKELRSIPPKEPYIYYDFNINDYTVRQRKTKKIETSDV